MNALYRSDLGDTLRQREIYLRDGIPPALMSGAIKEARQQRARIFRAFSIRAVRILARLARLRGGKAELGSCDCGAAATP